MLKYYKENQEETRQINIEKHRNNETNIFAFKIVVITTKNFYAINRYIDENKLGCY